jgi:hypothetical protein
MPEIGTSGSMSGDGKRSDCPSAQATAPILDSTALHPGYGHSGLMLALRISGHHFSISAF